jgi:hypothetical protein
MAAYRAGDYAASTSHYTSLLMSSPKNPSYHAYLANSIFRQGNLKLAEKGFLKAIELDPTNARYYSNLGAIHVMMQNYGEAQGLFEVAMQLNPGDGTLKKNRDTAKIQALQAGLTAELASGNGTTIMNVFTGRNYSNEQEVLLRMVVDENVRKNPPVVASAVEFLRAAVKEVPEFAISKHVLANTLEDIAFHENDAAAKKALLDEAKDLVVSALGIQDRVAAGGDMALESRMCVTENCKKTYAEEQDEAAFDEAVRNAPIRVVCVSTSMRNELVTLQKSAEHLNLKFDILGMGTPWHGLGSKITLLWDYLKDVDDNEILLFVDAFDVLLLPDALDIRNRFADSFTGSKVVLSGEKECSPDKSSRVAFPYLDYDKPFQFLNSGSYIGLVKHIKLMLADVSEDIRAHHAFTGASPLALDDQRWFTRYYLRNPGVAGMDVDGVMFHTLHDIGPDEFTVKKDSNGVVLGMDSNVTHGSPCLLHGNANGLSTLHVLVDRLIDEGFPKGVSKEMKLAGGTTSAIRLDGGTTSATLV